MSQKIDVVAHIEALPGEEAMVREVLESYIAPTRLEDGCLRYDLFVDQSNSGQFTFIEEWASIEALQKHSQSAHLAAGRPRVAGKLAGPNWVQILDRVG